MVLFLLLVAVQDRPFLGIGHFRAMNHGKKIIIAKVSQAEDIWPKVELLEDGIDLFVDYDNIPPEVKKILDKHEDAFEDEDYRGLEQAKKELEDIGYTFDYYLDGVAYDLRPIGTKGASGESFKSGGYMAEGGENKDDVWTFGQGTIKLNGEPVYS